MCPQLNGYDSKLRRALASVEFEQKPLLFDKYIIKSISKKFSRHDHAPNQRGCWSNHHVYEITCLHILTGDQYITTFFISFNSRHPSL